jgi:hypothetical protein
MRRREETLPLKSWAKPEHRRMVTGSAGFGGDTSVDGSGTLS